MGGDSLEGVEVGLSHVARRHVGVKLLPPDRDVLKVVRRVCVAGEST